MRYTMTDSVTTQSPSHPVTQSPSNPANQSRIVKKKRYQTQHPPHTRSPVGLHQRQRQHAALFVCPSWLEEAPGRHLRHQFSSWFFAIGQIATYLSWICCSEPVSEGFLPPLSPPSLLKAVAQHLLLYLLYRLITLHAVRFIFHKVLDRERLDLLVVPTPLLFHLLHEEESRCII